MAKTLSRDAGHPRSDAKIARAEKRHSLLFRRMLPKPRALPGAAELLKHLRERKVLHGIATSGKPSEIAEALKAIGVTPGNTAVVDSEDVAKAKPEPDAFLVCAEKLKVDPQDCYLVGDAAWDLLAAQRARMLSIGVLTGGSGAEELTTAGAYRVFRDPAELDRSLESLGLMA